MKPARFVLLLLPLLWSTASYPQPRDIQVIGYYLGNAADITRYPVAQLTHLVFSFAHLQNGLLHLDKKEDTVLLRNMIALKQRYPSLKVLVSLGGWGGCATCSPTFATASGRKAFAHSARQLLDAFGADGLDLDWEYPALEGYTGHAFAPDDRLHFTRLVKQLRRVLGKQAEISFAAGSSAPYLHQSVDWLKVMPLVNRVNLMTYDVGTGSGISRHHTPLYGSAAYPQSVDFCVRYLDSIGVAPGKIAVGVAFYAHIYAVADTLQQALYRPAVIKPGISYKDFAVKLADTAGWVYRWDSTAQAPYRYHPANRLFATFDDSSSVRLKTQYAIRHQLNGIMFWQLADDQETEGLLKIIDATRRQQTAHQEGEK